MMNLCDVCGREDGLQNMNMQQCQSCGVCVHETCYGLTNYATEGKKHLGWKCAPCSAIGQKLRVSKPSERYRAISITSRCTECAVCSVNTGNHAMHLLYNRHGEEGTPLVLPANKRKGVEERVAWVHTLCALFIGSREKVIFGCKKDGTYLGEDDEFDDDEESNHQELDGEELLSLNNPHHFVVAGAARDCEDDVWARAIRDVKEARYKCFICGLKNGMKRHTLAIPCCHENCSQSFHVGCARWGKLSERFDRIKFNPGAFNDREEDYNPATALGYCNIHSKKRKDICTVIKKQDLRENISRKLKTEKACLKDSKRQNGSQLPGQKGQNDSLPELKPVTQICVQTNENKIEKKTS